MPLPGKFGSFVKRDGFGWPPRTSLLHRMSRLTVRLELSAWTQNGYSGTAPFKKSALSSENPKSTSSRPQKIPNANDSVPGFLLREPKRWTHSLCIGEGSVFLRLPTVCSNAPDPPEDYNRWRKGNSGRSSVGRSALVPPLPPTTTVSMHNFSTVI